MKSHLFCWVFLVFFSAPSLAQKKDIAFKTTTTSSYCKGIAPRDGEETKGYTPTEASLDIYIYRLDTTKVSLLTSLKTPSVFSLKSGTYICSFSDKLSLEQIKLFVRKQAIPDDYYPNWPHNSQIIRIDKDTKEVICNFHHYCPWELNPNLSPPPSMDR